MLTLSPYRASTKMEVYAIYRRSFYTIIRHYFKDFQRRARVIRATVGHVTTKLMMGDWPCLFSTRRHASRRRIPVLRLS